MWVEEVEVDGTKGRKSIYVNGKSLDGFIGWEGGGMGILGWFGAVVVEIAGVCLCDRKR